MRLLGHRSRFAVPTGEPPEEVRGPHHFFIIHSPRHCITSFNARSLDIELSNSIELYPGSFSDPARCKNERSSINFNRWHPFIQWPFFVAFACRGQVIINAAGFCIALTSCGEMVDKVHDEILRVTLSVALPVSASRPWQ